MKNFNKLMFAALATVSMFATSCGDDEKENDPTPVPVVVQPDKKVLLAGDSSKAWMVTKVLYNDIDVSNEASVAFYLKPYIFRKNGTYVTYFSTTSFDGTWEFQASETMLVLNKGGGTNETNWTIKEITANSLKIKRGTLVSGNPVNMEWQLIPR